MHNTTAALNETSQTIHDALNGLERNARTKKKHDPIVYGEVERVVHSRANGRRRSRSWWWSQIGLMSRNDRVMLHP
jgi:hypothetical protein